jgi:hypothetical protein
MQEGQLLMSQNRQRPARDTPESQEGADHAAAGGRRKTVVHGLRGKPSNRKIEQKVQQQAIQGAIE